jgi:hypothetical protein
VADRTAWLPARCLSEPSPLAEEFCREVESVRPAPPGKHLRHGKSHSTMGIAAEPRLLSQLGSPAKPARASGKYRLPLTCGQTEAAQRRFGLIPGNPAAARIPPPTGERAPAACLALVVCLYPHAATEPSSSTSRKQDAIALLPIHHQLSQRDPSSEGVVLADFVRFHQSQADCRAPCLPLPELTALAGREAKPQ